jgi:hypothetical protein
MLFCLTLGGAHQAALYDACLLIVNTYYQTDMLDFYDTTDCDSLYLYEFCP